MNSRVLEVFYGQDLLPYKDKERSVHYPITGNSFAGSHKVNTIRFYVDQIGGTSGISWVIVSKLPNGKIGYEPLSAIGYDDEGTPYLDFDMSGYYTSVKGDLYLALRGYQGQIEFTDKDEDGNDLPSNVYRIVGDPLIEVTGTIKFAINYSPMVNTGTQVLPTDVDRLISALGNYIANGNGIVVLPNTSADISGYENGQMFYVKSVNQFYQLSSGNLVKVDIGLPFEFGGGQTAQELYQKYGARVFTMQYFADFLICAITYNYLNYLYEFNVYKFVVMAGEENISVVHFGTNTGTDTFAYLYNNATNIKTFTTKEYVENHFVGLTGNQTIAGQKTFSGKAIFSDANLYNGYLTTNSKNYFARVGVTTGQYVTYKLPYNYSEVGAVSLTLATENYVDDQIKIAISSVYQVKGSATVSELNTLTSTTVDKSTLNGYVYNVTDSGNLNYYAGTMPVLAGDNVVFTYNNGQWGWDKLAGIIDLSGYVEKTTTIAGIDLQDDITAQELSDALTYATNTDIDNLF